MAQDIKRKIVLEGEKEYIAALKEAHRNLRTLRSELKAETAELGANATAQQKNETRIKSLQKQIAEQEKAVKTCQAALANAKAEYSDNKEVVAKWEQKLNDARATLANMKNDLESTSQAVRDTGNSFKEAADGAAATVTATKSVADALGQIGSVGDSISGAIESIFTGMLQTIERAVETAWEIVSETAAKANNWGDIAGYWGTDAQTIQQYARAMSASGKEFEKLNSIVTKIVLGGKGKTITEMLGISGVNYRDEWAYAIAVLNQLHEFQQSGKNMPPIYEAVFGEKKSVDVMDIVNSWEEITGNLATFNGNETGYGLTDEGLQAMSDLWVEINKVEEKFTALKERFAEGLGVATGSLLVNVEGSLDALADFIAAETPEEREKALDDLRTNVEEFFTKVGDILREGIAILGEVGKELQESDDPLTALIGDILVKITEGLQWIVDNKKAVKIAFETIFGAWLLAKLAAVAGKLSSILMQIEVIKEFKGLELGGAGSGGSANGKGITGGGSATGGADDYTTSWIDRSLSVGTFFNSLKERAVKLLKNLGKAAKTATPYIGFGTAVAGAATLVDASGTKATQDLLEELNSLAENREGIDAVSQALKALGAAYEEVVAGNGDIKSTLKEIDPETLRQIIPDSDMFKQLDQWYGGDWGKFLDDQPGTNLLEWVEEFARAAVAEAHKDDAEAPEDLMKGQAQAPAQEFIMAEGINLPETAEALHDAMYKAINDYEPETNQLNTTDYFDSVLYPMIRKQAKLGGVEGDDADAIADLIYDKWIQSMYDEGWEGSTEGILSILQEAIEEAVEGLVPEQQPEQPGGPTDQQKEAAETFWDIFRQSLDGAPDAFDSLLAAFEGNDELLAKLDALIGELEGESLDDNWRSIENLPPNWWLDAANWQNSGKNNNGITSSDLAGFRSLPGSMAAAVQSGAARGVSGIKVVLDGATVGRLVAPYVSESIARDVIYV